MKTIKDTPLLVLLVMEAADKCLAAYNAGNLSEAWEQAGEMAACSEAIELAAKKELQK